MTMEMGLTHELTQEQMMFQESLQRVLRKSLPVDAIRRFADGDATFNQTLWDQGVELGLSGLLVPEEHGGTGLGMLEAALAAEALGNAAAPMPFAGPCVMAPQAVRLYAQGETQAHWLRQIATGDARIAVVFTSRLSGQTGNGLLEAQGERLSGGVASVMDCAGATHILTVLGDGRAGLVEAGAEGCIATSRRSLDRTRPLTDLRFDKARIQWLGNANPEAAGRVLAAGRLALAADSLGAAQNMFDKAVAYAGEREQFGRIIGSYQGVKYMCADMVTALEPCRAMVWHGGNAQEGDALDVQVTSCHVKAHVSDVARMVARVATEVHGGIGFTDLLGLHYWLRRISFNRQVLGSAEICRLQAARLQGFAQAT
jgi:alkylation response protein AidB-like acyl-CoA dehydrogenase